MKRVTKIGLLCSLIMLLLNRFFDLPFLTGLFMGAAICFLVLGLLPEKAIDSLREWKRSILHRS